MSTAIDTMMTEHRIIEGVMNGLEGYASSEAATPAGLAEFVDFFGSYADALHHAREENVLFEMLVAHNMPRDTGPIQVMLHEHETGRALMELLREASTRDSWSPHDRDQVVSLAGQFISLLRNHIIKEDNVLYPMALSILPEAAIGALDDRCASLEANDDQKVRLEQLARLLTQSGRR